MTCFLLEGSSIKNNHVLWLTWNDLHPASLVMMAEGKHAYPSRTRPLSPPAPMVLGPQGPGRVGRRQATRKDNSKELSFLYVKLHKGVLLNEQSLY